MKKIFAILIMTMLAVSCIVSGYAETAETVETERVNGLEYIDADYDAVTVFQETVYLRPSPNMEITEQDEENFYKLPNCAKVHVSQEAYNKKQQITWCYVTFEDISGWVLLTELDIHYPEEGYPELYPVYDEEIEYEEYYMEDGTNAIPVEGLVYEEATTGIPAQTSLVTDSYWVDNVYDDPQYWYQTESEKYETYDESGFQLVQTSPLSTFAADVDTASYSNIRRMITDGYTIQDIPKEAVRPEEFVNYFTYNFDKPKNDEMFSVHLESSSCPWNMEHELLMVGIRAKDVNVQDIPQNLVFLIDVSGSMDNRDKLGLVKQSINHLIDTLNSSDTISIVTYASQEELVLDGENPIEKEVGHLKAMVNQLYAEGSTAGEKGLEMAYDVAARHYIEGGNNRIIMMTDGDLNVGISDPDELEAFIKEKAKSGIYLSTFGFGTGNLRDDALERLADCGNGNYSYIDSMLEAKKVLVDEAASTLFTVANDVKFQIEFNPENINAYRLIGYENRRLEATDFRDDTKDAGEIGSGHEVVALYELIPTDSEAAVNLKYGQAENKNANEMSNEIATLTMRWRDTEDEKAEEKEIVITKDVYEKNPSDDFKFACIVTEFAQTLQKSKNAGNSSLDHVYELLLHMELDDEYKEEFKYLIRTLLGNEY